MAEVVRGIIREVGAGEVEIPPHIGQLQREHLQTFFTIVPVSTVLALGETLIAWSFKLNRGQEDIRETMALSAKLAETGELRQIRPNSHLPPSSLAESAMDHFQKSTLEDARLR